MSLVLDTNVVSELIRPKPSAAVLDWFASEHRRPYISAITRAELLIGVLSLPAGKRRRELEAAIGELLDVRFGAWCLPFDSGAADAFARIEVARLRTGRLASTEDSQIAAIALTHGLAVVTRNVAHFEAISGVEVMNPWDS